MDKSLLHLFVLIMSLTNVFMSPKIKLCDLNPYVMVLHHKKTAN